MSHIQLQQRKTAQSAETLAPADDIRGLSEKLSASNLDGNTIGKIFLLSWYIYHKHPCENESHSIKYFVLYSCLKQECCLYPLKWINLSIVRYKIICKRSFNAK
jgi:hypothetical protein